MITIKPYMIGEDQYIDLPKEFNFKGSEVEISRDGDDVILREKPIAEEKDNTVIEQSTDLTIELNEGKSSK